MEKNKYSDEVKTQVYQSYDSSMPGETLKPLKNKNISIHDFPSSCYVKKLSISDLKYKDLMGLCKSGIIPNKYNNEYIDMLPHKEIPDILNETDEEDDNIDNVHF